MLFLTQSFATRSSRSKQIPEYQRSNKKSRIISPSLSSGKKWINRSKK